MDIRRSGSQPSGKGPAEWFTGTVRIDPLFPVAPPARAAGNAGRLFVIKKVYPEKHVLVIQPVGGERIEDDACLRVRTEAKVYTIVSDGANWQVVGAR